MRLAGSVELGLLRLGGKAGRSATRQWRDELAASSSSSCTPPATRSTVTGGSTPTSLAPAGTATQDTVLSIMRERGLEGCQPRAKRRCTTKQAAEVADIPDLVGRDFTSDIPGAKLVGDITYVATAEGWLYVALVIDCFSRAIVGWAMADNYKTPLITAAVRMAARRLTIPSDAVFHSDRGSNYTSDEYARCSASSVCVVPSAAPEYAMIMPWLNQRTAP